MRFEDLRKEDFELIKKAMMGHSTELLSEAVECKEVMPKEVYEENIEESKRLLYLVDVLNLEGTHRYSEIVKEYCFMIKAKETIEDQFGKIRLIKDIEYALLEEYEGTFSVIDETGTTTVFGKERFYEIKED